MSTSRDTEIAGNFQQNEIATFAFEAAQKPFTESICRNPDAVLALELQKLEVENQGGNDESEEIARQIQELERFQQEQNDGNVATRVNDVISNRSDERVERNTFVPLNRSDTVIARNLYEDEIANSAFIGAQKPLTESIIMNPDAMLALELQKLEVDDGTRVESNRLAIQLQEQENLEQAQHDANIAQSLADNDQRESTTAPRDRIEEEPETYRIPTIMQDRGNRIPNSDVRPNQRHPRLQRLRRVIPNVRDETERDNSDSDEYEALWNIQEGNGDVRRGGLTKNQIDRIPHHKYRARLGSTRSAHDSCSICLSDYRNGEYVKTLTCCHSYHKKCIEQWLKGQAVCPVCRQNITIE